MGDENITTADKVVLDFLDGLAQDSNLNQPTVAAITKLHTDGKLTRTNLLRKLETLRQAEAVSQAVQGSDEDG